MPYSGLRNNNFKLISIDELGAVGFEPTYSEEEGYSRFSIIKQAQTTLHKHKKINTLG